MQLFGVMALTSGSKRAFLGGNYSVEIVKLTVI
jgi:hypothetical protein